MIGEAAGVRTTHCWICIAATVFICCVLSLSAAAQVDEPHSDTLIVDSTTIIVEPPPAPISNLQVVDLPNDHGHAFHLTWNISADDLGGRNNVLQYRILRTPGWAGPLTEPQGDGPQWRNEQGTWWHLVEGVWDTIASIPAGTAEYFNRGGKAREGNDYSPDDVGFSFKILSVGTGGAVSESAIFGPVESSGQWYHTGKTWVVLAVLIFGGLMLTMVRLARGGRELYIRPLAGINAVDEAIGRATEMGRPILYVLGLGAPDEIATIASFTILSRVAKKVAEYQTELIVPCYDSIVMTIAQETVKQAYIDAGRVDDYNEDMVYFVTQNQFAYVAAVNGVMLRRQTATNFYLGVFYAESLILAETGSLAGSIQISGTDRVTQLPFFVVACDYTLIGEELYAASAYLGREPILLGTLKAQDYAKALLLVAMVIGVIAGILNLGWLTDYFALNI
jgi:hypothetical protein